MIEQWKEDMSNTDHKESSRELAKLFEEIMITNQDSLRDHAGSDEEENVNHVDNEYSKLGNLHEDDLPSCMVDSIFNIVLLFIDSVWQQWVKLGIFKLRGRAATADYFNHHDTTNRITALKVAVVVHPLMDQVAATFALTIVG
jgi:hypothetical protein